MVVFQAMRRLEVGIGRILIFVVVVLVGAVIGAIIAIPELDSVSMFEWLGYRFFEVNNEVIYQTFYVYPHYLPHTWGMNIGLVHLLFGSGDLAVGAYPGGEVSSAPTGLLSIHFSSATPGWISPMPV